MRSSTEHFAFQLLLKKTESNLFCHVSSHWIFRKVTIRCSPIVKTNALRHTSPTAWIKAQGRKKNSREILKRCTDGTFYSTQMFINARQKTAKPQRRSPGFGQTRSEDTLPCLSQKEAVTFPRVLSDSSGPWRCYPESCLAPEAPGIPRGKSVLSKRPREPSVRPLRPAETGAGSSLHMWKTDLGQQETFTWSWNDISSHTNSHTETFSSRGQLIHCRHRCDHL